MLALFEAERTEGRGRRCRETVEAADFLGVNCLKLRAAIPARAGSHSIERCLKRCEDTLRSLRIAELCFKKDFPYQEYFLRRGFGRIGAKYLMRSFAGEIALKAAKGRESAYLHTKRLDSNAFNTLKLLCREFRYVTADIPREDIPDARELAESHGVSLTFPGRERLINADMAVFFGEPQRLTGFPDSCRILFTDGVRGDMVCGGREIKRIAFNFPECYKERLPEGYPEDELLSAAFLRGGVTYEDIKVITAEI